MGLNLSPMEWAVLGAFFLLGVLRLGAVLCDAEAARRSHGDL